MGHNRSRTSTNSAAIREPSQTGTVPAPSRSLVRPYQPGDHDAVYEVCVRTGDGGRDARGKYPNDDLLPDIYAGPYLYLEPELAFVLDDGGRAVGYVIGTADTNAFVRRYREQWLPALAGRYHHPGGRPASAEDEGLARLYRPERMLVAGLAGYPAHLHIDLLPPYQRSGYGRRLIENFAAAAARAGAPGVHVAVGPTNTGAQEFYQRVGFAPVPVRDPDNRSLYFGRVIGTGGVPAV
jgi:ribosomal protein S18 acetylase RimI-like enzyme